MLAALRYESVDGQFRQEMEPHRGEKRKANPDLGNKNLGIGWIRSKLPQEHCFICVIRSKRSGLALQAACWKLLAEIISLKLVPVSDTGRYMLAFAVQAVTTGLIGLQTGIFLCQDHMVSYEEIREDVADIIRNISLWRISALRSTLWTAVSLSVLITPGYRRKADYQRIRCRASDQEAHLGCIYMHSRMC